MLPIVTKALANPFVRYTGVALLCLTLGFTKGCQVGTDRGMAKVQKQYDKYKTEVVENLAVNNTKVEEAVRKAREAQDKMLAMQAERRLKTDRELAALNKRIDDVFEERVSDPNCKWTDDELRIAKEAFDRTPRSGSRVGPH